MRTTIILFFLALIATACTPDNLAPVISETPEYIVQVNEEVLQEDRVFTDGLTLPAGSLITTDANGSQLKFQLPNGYRTLIYDQSSKQVVLGKSFGGYSCTCSSTGSCTVFSAPGAGYGCLQSTCEGSCTGKKTGGNGEKSLNHTLVGIVHDNEALVSFTPSDLIVSIDPMFIGSFFKSELVSNALSDVYQNIYGNLSDFTPPQQENVPGNFIPDGYVAIPAYILGIEFAITVPADKELLNYLAPDGKISVSNRGEKSVGGVTCTGSNNCTCTQDSMWTPKGRIYYCTGCTTCTMSDNEE